MSWQDNVNDDYEKLFETDEGYDVIIYAGENENVKELHAYSNILRIRSQYFRTALSDKWAKKKDGKFILEKPNISPNIFKIILRFIYCGKIDITKLEVPELLKLLMAVDELSIQSLTPRIEEYLIKHQYEFLQQNPIGILETIYQNETFTSLLDYCLNKICKEPEILFNTDKFIDLKAPIIELLIKQNDLCLEEIEIWDNLLKWAFAQNPTISEDVTKWNKEEVTIMERTLHRYIPLIRFYYISSEDFHDKVFPFKEILPKDLINNILVFHMAPDEKLNVDVQSPRKPKCVYDSVIISDKHFAIFSSWIENKNESYYNVNNIPYKFNLLYRASRDGNTIATFHAKCDNKGATIVIVKITNSEQIVGGYNPLYWDSSNGWKPTSDSFIFSFANKDNLQSAKLGYSNYGDPYSVFGGNVNYGPLFGGGHDLGFSNNRWYRSCSSSYPDVGIPLNNFQTDDYEVFQVVKK